jgi:hypothetical protein
MGGQAFVPSFLIPVLRIHILVKTFLQSRSATFYTSFLMPVKKSAAHAGGIF